MRTSNRKLFQDNNLVHAVINCDYESVKKILESSDYDESCINDIGGFTKDVPIFILSVCYSIILNPEDYTDNMDPFLKAKYEENNKILNLFAKQFAFKNNNIILEDYIQYFNETEEDLLEEPEPHKTFKEFYISENLDKYKSKNYREIDLRLYYAVTELCSYHEIKQCCEAGANPDFTLPENESPIEYVAHDISGLDVEVYSILKKQRKEIYDIWDIVNISWCARHQQNYNLMLHHCK